MTEPSWWVCILDRFHAFMASNPRRSPLLAAERTAHQGIDLSPGDGGQGRGLPCNALPLCVCMCV